MYVHITNREVRSCNDCCWGKAITITYWECVCVYSLRYPACNAHVQDHHLWPAPLYNIFPRYLINGTIFEKAFERKMCVVISATFSSETFLILRKHE